MKRETFADNALICFCFKHTKADIEDDLRRHDGKSMLMAQILAEKKAGGCNCKNTNPKGR